MTRIVLITFVLLAMLAGGSVGALAWADGKAGEQLPAGALVGGVDVGGLTREQALEHAERRVGSLIARPAHIELGDRRYTLTPDEAGVRIDLRSAIERAYDAGREGSFVSRGWRKLTGGRLSQDVPVQAVVDGLAVRRFVERIAKQQARAPVDAELEMTLTSVTVKPERAGRRLAARDALVARLTRRLTSSTDERTLRGKTIEVPAKVTEEKLLEAQPIAVTVSRDGKRARVFRRGELIETYTVAVGTTKYPTPTGRYVVQTMQVNPAWNVPRSEWAGDLAGQTIPGGDPRNPLIARWIGFNGSVGFHGTNSAGSLGTAASHGCVRMAPSDVISLYKQVKVGTPVLVA
ncbi:MAG: L,D-transpeptidase/peptidoglycan binding protein [Solirubrobacteraceae bacterium]|nr:L,D-transpeptidase/peptidoglycan binding protein [Solirubrobacteraceae bacterium]